MNALFPLGEITFQKVAQDGAILKSWKAPELNMKANVVCKKCNETWMSDIESQYAAPAMSDLILGKHVGEVSKKRARGIALFAFKTAVVGNHMGPENEEFFDTAQRYAFRESHLIPDKVAMWLFGCEPNVAGAFRSNNVTFPGNADTALTLNVCTFSIGHLGFQVVSARTDAIGDVESISVPPGLTAFFHPILRDRFSWPRSIVLAREAFDSFHGRWNRVKFP